MSKQKLRPSFHQRLTNPAWPACAPPQPVSDVSPVGITKEPMQQAVENQTATEVSCLSEIASDTSQSETPSGSNSKRERRTYSYTINTTQCCGMHTLSGFQQGDNPDCIDVILSINKTYITQLDCHRQTRAARRKYEEAYYAIPEAGRKNLWVGPTAFTGALHIAGMIVFTWNHPQYDKAAKKLSDFIVKNGLGSCSFSGKVFNPNSTNRIEAMTWLVNQVGYTTFIEEHNA